MAPRAVATATPTGHLNAKCHRRRIGLLSRSRDSAAVRVALRPHEGRAGDLRPRARRGEPPPQTIDARQGTAWPTVRALAITGDR